MGPLLFALLACTFAIPACSHTDNSVHVPAIRKILGQMPSWVDKSPLGHKLWSVERAFYERHQFLPAWVDVDRATPRMEELIEQLRDAEVHGLEPQRYGTDRYERAVQSARTKFRGVRFELEAVAELDTELTYAYLRYASDLLGWSSSPRNVSKYWLASPRNEDVGARLEAAVAGDRVRETLEELAPSHPQYKGLQAALARERNVSTGHRDVIRMNLERWRWTTRDLGDRYILVNVPAYQLQVVEGEKPVLAMRVIVGKPDLPTPLFSDEMTYVVFSPYWNIPENILRQETLPRVANDPEYLVRNNIEVVSGGAVLDPGSIDWANVDSTRGLRFRQGPGPENALGLVKFIFPNHFNVYLHDTPGDRLFSRPSRAFSHGCIRVEKPVALAQYVLRDQPQWTTERISRAMNAHSEQAVTLKKSLPVHIGYWTAWVEPDGSVTYTEDPYGLDRAQSQAQGLRL